MVCSINYPDQVIGEIINIVTTDVVIVEIRSIGTLAFSRGAYISWYTHDLKLIINRSNHLPKWV